MNELMNVHVRDDGLKIRLTKEQQRLKIRLTQTWEFPGWWP